MFAIAVLCIMRDNANLTTLTNYTFKSTAELIYERLRLVVARRHNTKYVLYEFFRIEPLDSFLLHATIVSLW